MHELEQVVLTTDIPEHDLKAGDIGTIVLIHGDHEGYEVEFVTLDGKTVAVVTVLASQIRPVQEREIAHARRIAAA